MNAATALRVFLATLCIALLGACGPRISAENYERVVKGMAEKRVGDILGLPSESRNATVRVQGETFTSTQSTWKNDKGTIVVEFLNGEVQSKAYYRPGEEPPPNRR